MATTKKFKVHMMYKGSKAVKANTKPKTKK